MSARVATYLYCLVKGARAPSTTDAPPGLPGSTRTRAIPAGEGIWIVAGDAPLDRYGEEQIAAGLKDMEWVSRCALAHERVVEHFLRAPALLPMKIFTLFADDARAIAHVARKRKTIDKALERVAGRVEWGVRVALGPDGPDGPAARAGDGRGDASASDSGAAFLMAKKQARDAVKVRAERATEAAVRIHDGLAALAEGAERRAPDDVPGSRLLLDAAYLVPISRAASFRKKADALAAESGKSGVIVTVTGPWPAYHFVGQS
jgi:hypothetical protein